MRGWIRETQGRITESPYYALCCSAHTHRRWHKKGESTFFQNTTHSLENDLFPSFMRSRGGPATSFHRRHQCYFPHIHALCEPRPASVQFCALLWDVMIARCWCVACGVVRGEREVRFVLWYALGVPCLPESFFPISANALGFLFFLYPDGVMLRFECGQMEEESPFRLRIYLVPTHLPEGDCQLGS